MANQADREILSSIPCSRNLRRRTGVLWGLEVPEIMTIALLTVAGIFLTRTGILAVSPFYFLLGVPGLGVGFVKLFKKDKQPNYFILLMKHKFFHPAEGWRAPKTMKRDFPIFKN